LVDPKVEMRIRRFHEKCVYTEYGNKHDGFTHDENMYNAEYSDVHRILAEDTSGVKAGAAKNHLGIADGTQFLVKWQALAYDECTWEYVSDLSGYETALEKFRKYNIKYVVQWKCSLSLSL
jgi:hypothetical protein